MTSVAKPRKKRKPANVTKQADLLFSGIVRSRGECEARDGFPCFGPLQCAHGISRRYRTVRWDTRNGFALCASHHMRYTQRPLEWEEWLLKRQGWSLYWKLRNIAKTGPKPDMDVVLAELKQLA